MIYDIRRDVQNSEGELLAIDGDMVSDQELIEQIDQAIEDNPEEYHVVKVGNLYRMII